MLKDKIYEIINKYKNEENRLAYNEEIEEKIISLLANKKIQFKMSQFTADYSPGYEVFYHVCCYIDENGKLELIKWIEECY